MKKNLLYLLVTILTATVFFACENPFDPLDTSSEIRGLQYIDFSLTWEYWDSDPAGDGVVVSPEYLNEFGDSLSFHDKSHRLVIEFYTQKLVGQVPDENGLLTGGSPTLDALVFAFPVNYDNTTDDIRIPVEAYRAQLIGAGYDLELPADAFVVLRVFPPKEIPRSELVAFYANVAVFEPEPTALVEDEILGDNAPTVTP